MQAGKRRIGEPLDDDKCGYVDLSLMAAPKANPYHIEAVYFRTVRHRLWYFLNRTEDTEKLSYENTLNPVDLKISNPVNPFSEKADVSYSLFLPIHSALNWLRETRHIQEGAVAVANCVMKPGDPLTIDGRKTSPTDLALVVHSNDREWSRAYGWKF